MTKNVSVVTRLPIHFAERGAPEKFIEDHVMFKTMDQVIAYVTENPQQTAEFLASLVHIKVD